MYKILLMYILSRTIILGCGCLPLHSIQAPLTLDCIYIFIVDFVETDEDLLFMKQSTWNMLTYLN